MKKISWLDPALRQADTVQVMVQVHQGKLSPGAAEEWAKANGRPPFVPAIGSAPNPPSEVKAATTAAAETRCRQALVELMRADPGNPIPKETLKLKFPGVSGHGFDRAFAEAAKEAPAPAWRAKGRRKKAAPVIATPN